VGDGSGVVWFNAPGLEVLGVSDDGVEVTIAVETTATVVGSPGCWSRARAKDRRWVTLRDAPLPDRAVRLRWRKRIWSCPESACDVRTWTEQHDLAEPRRVLTRRAARWAAGRVAAVEATPASLARGFGLSWSTAWTAVRRLGQAAVEDPARVGPVTMIGFDETVLSPESRRRRRRFVTAVVDVETSQILDVFEGRDAKDLRAWMARQPKARLAGVEVVSVDPHEGYRSAILAPNPDTNTPSPLAEVTVVVDPFHIVRLANAAVTKTRRRVQHETLGHRGWAGDPLYRVRKLLLRGAERLDENACKRLHDALAAGDPDDAVSDAWTAKEKVRDIYRTDDPAEAARIINELLDWCDHSTTARAELATLAKTIRRWRTEILAHQSTGASNGPVEAANLLIKQVKRSGRGSRNPANYRLRILLAGGQNPTCKTQPVTSIRTRRPRLVA